MSKEILNEIEETQTETEIFEIPQRANPSCVISKATFGEYAVRDIQTNSGWGENPYGEDYAVVPDDMVTAIVETRGFCDITLNEDGTEVVSFTAREIPEFPKQEPEYVPTNEELAEQIALNELTMIETYEAQEEFNAQTENALIEIYEMMEG